ncbi:MAG: hypothetical protein JWN04_5770 [Myxococcaceae bacterium]|nr:hypothetical protein [Myxococcaceae bacterium]
MDDAVDVARFLSAQPALMEILRTVARLSLPQGCIAAGALRNAVWDHLHGRPVTPHPRSDVDVIYFDPRQLSTEHEQQVERALQRIDSSTPWQVRNQARMQLCNGDPPYAGSVDAVSYYPETATAICAWLEDGELVLGAPLGVQDLLSLIVRPTPSFAGKLELYRARLASKDWHSRWPRLQFLDAD